MWRQWHWNLTVVYERLCSEIKIEREVTGFRQWVLIFVRPLCGFAASLTARPRQLEANQKWFMQASHNAAVDWICFIYGSLHHLSAEWTVLLINGGQTIDAVCKGTFPTVLSVMKMDTHWHKDKATDAHSNPTSESVYSKDIPTLHTPRSLSAPAV